MDDLQGEGLIEAATVAYSRAFDTEMVSMSLKAEVALISRPKYFDGRFLAARDLVRDQAYLLRGEIVQGEPERNINETVEQPHLRAIGSDEAFEIDCRLVSEQFGWGLEATRQHMRRQQQFRELVGGVEEELSEVFAGSAMARRPGEAAAIWFKGAAPEGFAARADRFREETGMRVEVVDGMRFSVAEQEARMEALSEKLGRRGFAGVGAAMLPGDKILVTLPASEEHPATTPSKVDAEDVPAREEPAVAGLLGDSVDPFGIQVAFMDGRLEGDHHARGRQVYSDTAADGTFSVCTRGFSVSRDSDGKNGIATAAHCTGMTNFDAEPGETDFDLYHKGEHCGDYGDVEWKTSDHVEPAEYWADPSDLRDVTKVIGSFSTNDVICVYSRMQGTRSCDEVYTVNVAQSGSSGYCSGRKAKKLIANTVGGDSGGPFSFGTEAAGLVKGYKTIWFKRRDTFSKAKLLDEALGVSVKTV